MNKITFKNPKGGTLYFTKVGFDWGAFWAMFALGGLPFFLRRMNGLGVFCLGFTVLITISMGFVGLSPDYTQLEITFIGFFYILFILGISIYLGLRGGKLTASHYMEEGYKCITKDDALVKKAKNKWGMEL